MGTDVAGSVRIPALCCGVYGFNPTADRIPCGGLVTGMMEGLPGLVTAAGPLANSLGDLRLFMSHVLGAEPWRYDATASAIPWPTGPSVQSPLTIGILPEDAHLPLHPPVRRALESAIEALSAKGHRIVRLKHAPQRSVSYANRLAFQYFTYGPLPNHISPSGEPLVASVAKGSSPMFSGPFPVSQELETFSKIDALHDARVAYAEAWREAWVSNGLDVVLGPGAQSTAVPHDTYGWPPYTAVWNVLDVCWINHDQNIHLSLIHISEPTRQAFASRMPSSA